MEGRVTCSWRGRPLGKQSVEIQPPRLCPKRDPSPPAQGPAGAASERGLLSPSGALTEEEDSATCSLCPQKASSNQQAESKLPGSGRAASRGPSLQGEVCGLSGGGSRSGSGRRRPATPPCQVSLQGTGPPTSPSALPLLPLQQQQQQRWGPKLHGLSHYPPCPLRPPCSALSLSCAAASRVPCYSLFS